jgi:hypothetical protein
MANIATLSLQSPALAVVKIFDGFGDADLDNDGVIAEPNDSDISGGGDGDVEPYVPLEDDITGEPGGTPPVFPAGTMVNEVTAAQNTSDVGIKWFSVGQWVATTGAPDPRASVHVIDDTASALPETNPSIGFYHAARSATSYAEAIDDGLALAVEGKGRGQPAAGFFGETIELGDEVGDEVRLSFDFRIWYSAPNINSASNNHVPVIGDFRFGIYQDSDGQLGDVSQKAGPLATGPSAGNVNDPRVWGEDHGYFRGDNLLFDPNPVGANGDKGWFVRVPIDDPNTGSFNQAFTAIGRINEETNEGTTGDNPRLMTGTTDHVSEPLDNTNPPTPFPTNGIDINKVYNFSLSLKRHDDPATEGNAGDTIFSQFTITERSSGLQWTWGDYEAVGVMAGGDPDGGVESDSWDYFTMALAGQSTSDDFDWLIDNFTVELFGSNAGLDGDYNGDGMVDAADYVFWRKTDGTQPGYDLWKQNFGASLGSGGGGQAASGGVPEPAGLIFVLMGAVSAAGIRRRSSRL